MRKMAGLVGCILLTSIVGGAQAQARAVAQDDECRLTSRREELPIFSAPIESYSHLLYLVKTNGNSYPILYQHLGTRIGAVDAEPFYYVVVDDEIEGWVSYFDMGGLQGDCHYGYPTIPGVPEDNTPLTDFPGICGSAIGRSATEYFIWCGHAMACYSPIDEATLYQQSCEGLEYWPTPAFTRGSVHVRSAPDAHTGEVLGTLPPMTKVMVIDGPVRGPIEAGSTGEGTWYRVFLEGHPAGWAWAGQLDVINSWHDALNSSHAPNSEENLFATAAWPVSVDSKARLWTLPDIYTGRGMSWVPAGTALQVLYGPVSGPIRYDSDEPGDWYYVVSSGDGSGFSAQRGWIWGGYLQFEEPQEEE
jgi:hypothetical protein